MRCRRCGHEDERAAKFCSSCGEEFEEETTVSIDLLDGRRVLEQEMGDVLEDEDPFTLLAKKGRKGQGQQAPMRDETLYEL